MIRRWKTSLRKRIARLTWTGGHRVVRRDGLLLLLDWRDRVDRSIAFHGDYERAQLGRLLSAMRRRRGCDVFLDIGANLGLYALRVASEGLAARVLAFEPDRRSLHQLAANLYLNRLSDRVELHEVAVSDRPGTARFQPAPETSTGQSHLSAEGVRKVACDTVDARLGGASGLTVFAKIDVEGHEAAAIAGMRRTLAQNRVFLQVESFAANLPRVGAALAAAGLAPAGRIGDDHYFTNIPEEAAAYRAAA